VARSPVKLKLHDSVALITIDDGKANVVTAELIDSLWRALDAAEADAEAVVIAGRPGVFSGGLDMNVLRAGGDPSMILVHKATDTCLRIVEFPLPVVAACTGHAVTGGAVLLLCCDLRICAEGDFRIGLNEVALGMPVPELVVGLARMRLSRRHLVPAVNCARLYKPAEAVEVGFLDVAHSLNVVGDAVRAAAGLAAELEPRAFAATRRTMTSRLAETIIRQAGAFTSLRDPRPPQMPPGLHPVAPHLSGGDPTS